MRIRERLCALAFAAMAALVPVRSDAAAYQVQARTEAQAYQIRSYRGADPQNPVLLPRRRIVQYLGANGFELVSGKDVGFESSLRIFADLGLPRGEAERLDGMPTEDLDILYANLHYRTGNFEGRLGRQVYVDMMDFMAFDGLRARYLRPLGRAGRFGAEVYGGLWVKGASLFGSSVYQLDGIRETDERRVAQAIPGADPTVDDIEPVFGVKLLGEELAGLGIGTSLGYRRSILGGKVTSERAAFEATYGKGRGLNGWGGFDLDLFSGSLAQARAQVRYDQPLYAASVEALRFSPIYSADSIFYYFVMAPRDEVRLRGDFLPPGPFRYYAGVLRSVNHTRINSSLVLADSLEDEDLPGGGQYGANVGGAARWSQTRAAVDLTWRNGFGGRQLWADVTGGYTSDNELYSLDGRLSVASVKDALNPLLRGNFYGLQVWGSYLLSPASRLSAVIEQNVNPFTRSDTKLFLLFDLRADL